MKLIVGLGNPGKEYEETKHNVGFKFLDELAKHHNCNINKEKFKGLYQLIKINDEQIMLLKPQKYMNLSGEVVKDFTDYFKIRIEDIIIIHDDLDLPCGKIRIRYRGRSGGHNGLKNIETNLNTTEYKRIKIGIGNDQKNDIIDFVLSGFSNTDKKILSSIYEQAPKIIEDYLNLSFEKFMNKYN